MDHSSGTGMTVDSELMWKTAGSGASGCPQRRKVTTPGLDGYVIVGKRLDAASVAQIEQIAGDEIAVFVPADVVDGLPA